MEIKYLTNFIPETQKISEVYDDSGIIRPTNDSERIKEMYRNSNLVITAWDGEILVGIARSLTDFVYSCYLSDLAVKKQYQKSGIGKTLIEITRKEIGEGTMLLLLAAAPAMTYYPKLGMEKVENGFIIKRKR